MADGGPSRSSGASSLEIEIVRHSDLWDSIEASGDTLSRAALAAFAATLAAPDGAPCVVTLVLTDDFVMRELKSTWRG